MLQNISSTVLSEFDDVQFDMWQHPVPVNHAHLVKSRMLEWCRARKDLDRRGIVAVQDKQIAVGSCVHVKPILQHLKREHGRELTVEHMAERITVDSQGWLAEHNSGGSQNETAFAAIDMPAVAGKQKQQSITGTGGQNHGLQALAAVFSPQQMEALATYVKGKGGGQKLSLIHI